MSDIPNPQAFPTHLHPESHEGAACVGMTLRDWFAGQALAGMGNWAPCPEEGSPIGRQLAAQIHRLKAEWAYAMADAMLSARSCLPIRTEVSA